MATVRELSWLGAERLGLENELASLLTRSRRGPDGPVSEAMYHAVFSGGKRVRALLVLGLARILSAEDAATLRLAAAIELVHCASLVLDDLPCMDDAASRRGAPAVHLKFGEAAAILASVALISLAARAVMEGAAGHVPRWQAMQHFQSHLLAAAGCDGMIRGQMLDLQGEQSAVTADWKTVPLFTLAVEAGSLFAQPPQRLRRELDRFAIELGRAFQKLDDIRDHECQASRVDFSALYGSVEKLAAFGLDQHALYELTDFCLGGTTCLGFPETARETGDMSARTARSPETGKLGAEIPMSIVLLGTTVGR